MQLFVNDMGLTSVRCRGLLVPHRAIASVLARSTRPLLFENDDPNYVYTKRGSCTLLAFHKEYFVVFTEHQRHGYSPAAIRIVQGFAGGPALATDTFIVVNPCGGEEIEDLIIEYDPAHIQCGHGSSRLHLRTEINIGCRPAYREDQSVAHCIFTSPSRWHERRPDILH